jgi:hypothetical protein
VRRMLPTRVPRGEGRFFICPPPLSVRAVDVSAARTRSLAEEVARTPAVESPALPPLRGLAEAAGRRNEGVRAQAEVRSGEQRRVDATLCTCLRDLGTCRPRFLE